MKVRIVLVPNVHMDSPNYKIKKLTYDNYDSSFNRSSYDLVETPEESVSYKAATQKPEAAVNKLPVVQNISPAEPAPMMGSRKQGSMFATLVKKIGEFFSPKPVSAETVNNKRPQRTNQGSRNNIKPRDNNSLRGERNSSNRGNQDRPERNSERVINHNNKTRPVPIAKSNDKIQTVRPTNSTKVVAEDSNVANLAPVVNNSVKQPEVMQQREPRGNNQERRNNNQQQRNGSPRNGAPRSNERSNEINNSRRVENSPVADAPTQLPVAVRKVRSSEALTPVPVEDKLNVADRSVVQTVFVASGSGAAVSMVLEGSSKVVDQNIKSVPDVIVANSQQSIAPVPTPIKREVRIEPVDLGDLQLVATDLKLLNLSVPEVKLVNVKRLSDVVVEEKVIDPNATYELVETKV
jgi:ribonuclease E